MKHKTAADAWRIVYWVIYRLILALLVCGPPVGAVAQTVTFPAGTAYANFQMGSAPAEAVFNNRLYVAFRANDSSNELLITSSSDGVNFTAATAYPNIQMGSAPALAVFNGSLYVAFRSNDSRNILFISSSSDGSTFPTATGYPNIAMGGAPSLAVFNNQLFVGFRANDPSNTLFTTSSSDGVSFPAGTASSAVTTGSDPSLAVLGSQLYVAYRANDSSNQLYLTSSSTGTGFPGGTGYSSMVIGAGPALTSFNNTLYVSFQDGDSSNRLSVAASSASAASGSGGSCWAAWDSTAVYTAGGQVSYNGVNYQAAYWTQGDNPAAKSGAQGSGQPWIPEGSCSAGSSSSGVGFSNGATNYDAILIGSAPAIVSFNSALYVGFRSNDSRNILFLTNSGGGTTTTPPPTGGPGLFAPYDDISIAEGETVVADAKTAGLKAITLAFMVDGGCVANWGGLGGSATSATLWNGTTISSVVSSLSNEGVQVIISWGGATGSVQNSCSDAASLQAMYQSVFDAYPSIIGQDFDIEGSVNATVVAQALAGLKKANPGKLISVTLPVLPSGLVTAGLNIINACHAAGFHPDTINVMAMDYGSANDNNGQMGLSAQQAAQATHNQTGDSIGITPDIGVNDTSSEVFQLSDAQSLVSFANANSYINRLGFWSLGRDNGGCAGQGSTSPTCSAISQSLFQFSSIFSGY
jgi:hypothetical protein